MPPPSAAAFKVVRRLGKRTLHLSARERHAIKWHLNARDPSGHEERRYIDRVWSALALDDVATDGKADVFAIDDDTRSPYQITAEERDALIYWLGLPKRGVMSRMLRRLDQQLARDTD
jgi:hypothetical protein